MELLEIAIAISVLMIGFYYWLTSTFNFWKLRGVPGPPPKPFFGNLLDVALGKLSIPEYLKVEYDAHKDERMFGIFLRSEPALVLRDPDLIKDILIKDFSTFPNRGKKIIDEIEPLTDHLFNLEATRWRPLRTNLAPVFTSGKLKKMFYLVLECGDELEKYLAKLTLKNDEVECRELAAKFTTDVIGRCFFGLEINALADGKNEFREMGKRVFTTDWQRIVKNRMRDFAPWLYSLLGPVIADWKMTNFFLNILREMAEYRKNNKIVKHDFFDLIMELKDNSNKLHQVELPDLQLAAVLVGFFAAGFETSSTTISNALYELAQHPTLQDKLRDAINQELAKSNGEITYEGIKSIKYLHMVFDETLRKYPPGFLFARKSMRPYTFAGTNLTIPNDTFVIVPTFAIHRDPLIYPNPEVFDPERFTDEAINARHSMNWLAFGDGPRMCIGDRFAKYQVKVGLIKILQNYKVDICEKTRIPYVINPESTVLTADHDIYLKMSKID